VQYEEVERQQEDDERPERCPHPEVDFHRRYDPNSKSSLNHDSRRPRRAPPAVSP
jgi:hypothetical protein